MRAIGEVIGAFIDARRAIESEKRRMAAELSNNFRGPRGGGQAVVTRLRWFTRTRGRR